MLKIFKISILLFLISNSANAAVQISEHFLSLPSSPDVDMLIEDLTVFLANSEPDYKKYFLFPVDGRISSFFGWRVDPVRNISAHHAGIDIAAARGQVVRAADSGRVSDAGWRRGCGLAVLIKHEDGFATKYCHLSKFFVRVGERVVAESPLGLVGDSGRATGNHLHFEISKSGINLDPLEHLLF
ncbi:MAG TPA: M23 family metallopeptidase [bacterium]|jgi:murein DD-endopeptidase MepM/ murein hydrolase activator NlpD|nr:M23 family metallopeptidase [Myxococcales bacterium]OQA62260.1 MAG: Murein DD-endopeptidase MepM [bacterium ADurb.Bin270]HPW45145.1 M23 family metallopeptidase [bacterium]HQC50549.1 M23 family metallopeptidase [bacterium]HQG13356.1 M23 family metallopeptidase [bacterium]